MRVLLMILLLSSTASAQSWERWVEGTRIGVNADNSKWPLAIYIGGNFDGWDEKQAVPFPMVPYKWHTVSVPSVPHDTLAVFLSGLLIITHPGSEATCSITATFRAPGSNWNEANYQMQTIEAHRGGGVRSNTASWVPVKNRQFEFYYTITPGCPSLINLSLQAYVR